MDRLAALDDVGETVSAHLPPEHIRSYLMEMTFQLSEIAAALGRSDLQNLYLEILRLGQQIS